MIKIFKGEVSLEQHRNTSRLCPLRRNWHMQISFWRELCSVC